MKRNLVSGSAGLGGWRSLCMAVLYLAFLGGCGGMEESSPSEETSMAGENEAATPEVESLEAPLASPVATNGKLQVVGNQIRNQSGVAIQLKGMSLFWSQWGGTFYNASVVNSLADNWKVTVVRAAMGVESGGYLTNPAAEKARVKTVVDAAIAKGLYVIIDWHDHNATAHTAQSKAFFTEMAQLYKNTPNVIFEIFNEPDNESWTQVRTYAVEIIGAIRGAGAPNLVVVGTPTWSQDVDVAAGNPITQYPNVAYALHFYAGTHKQFLRDKATTALNKGIALFVTEFGTCDASGNGNLNLAETQLWMDFMNSRKLSWANWSLNDKAETASALVPGANTTGNWPDSALTPSGAFIKQKLSQ
ncbi:Endo-1,4-beta-xylanase A precursor [Cystobacter fuscus]|uniref:Endo-1,4-beta-xylanase A n=1 Tax=Cystobacter fuscus TaxID=43 RepID=A0A250JGB1_9BACT|nr:glycoside hydrolase family 5 protein [Cystobacter fuscus]ATB42935.1 Endo-1,4-beta-xylanase A precursor [Cystobacter fuscus]